MKNIVNALEVILKTYVCMSEEEIIGNDLIGLSVLLPDTGKKIVAERKWFNGAATEVHTEERKETIGKRLKKTRTAARMSYAEAEEASRYIAEKCNGNKIAKAIGKLSAYQKEKYSQRSLERFLRGGSYADISSKYFVVDQKDKVISII